MEEPKLTIEPLKDDSSNTCCTYVFRDEDHTLGNALRYIIMKNPEVEFCGYSIPHPSDDKLLLRIQTKTNTLPLDVMKQGLEDLKETCEHVLTTFENQVESFVQSEKVL